MLIFVANIVFKRIMLQDKLVTIVCLCYNHEKFVIEALESVMQQSYKNIELIIVDDCSSDHSLHNIKKWLVNYPAIRFIANETNVGNTKAFNNALAFATGDFIIDFSADDILYPNCVNQQIQCFDSCQFKNLGIVYGNASLILENGSFNSFYFPVNNDNKIIEPRKTGNIYESVISGGNAICSVSAMYKKEVFDALKGYDENLLYEDLDFWIRASRLYEFDFVDAVLIKKRILSNSLGSGFQIKTDFRSRKINHSTYCSLKKALQLNKNKSEHDALLKRIHHEIYSNYYLKDYNLMLLCLSLALKTRLKSFFSKKS